MVACGRLPKVWCVILFAGACQRVPSGTYCGTVADIVEVNMTIVNSSCAEIGASFLGSHFKCFCETYNLNAGEVTLPDLPDSDDCVHKMLAEHIGHVPARNFRREHVARYNGSTDTFFIEIGTVGVTAELASSRCFARASSGRAEALGFLKQLLSLFPPHSDVVPRASPNPTEEPIVVGTELPTEAPTQGPTQAPTAVLFQALAWPTTSWWRPACAEVGAAARKGGQAACGQEFVAASPSLFGLCSLALVCLCVGTAFVCALRFCYRWCRFRAQERGHTLELAKRLNERLNEDELSDMGFGALSD